MKNRAYVKELAPGTTVRVKNIQEDYDADLNGRIGVLVRKHPLQPKFCLGDVGIVIEEEGKETIFANLNHGEYEEAFLNEN